MKKMFFCKLAVAFFVFIPFFNMNCVFAQFNISGNASSMGGGCFQLTPAQNSQSGAVWNTSMIDLSQDFDITLILNFGNNNGGADGMTFILQPISAGVSANGSGVGYEGITPSLGVVMDTHDNTDVHNDPLYDHMSLHKNGNVVHGHANELFPFGSVVGFPANVEDGLNHTFRFKWTAGNPNGTIQVWFDGVLSFTYSADIVNTVFAGNPHVYWGMSASTGGYNNRHTVCMSIVADFTSSPSCVENPIQFNDLSISSTPINSYTWDFGDGTVLGPGNYPNPSHVYDSPGVYTTQLTITNSAGLSSTTSATVRVYGVEVNALATPDTICLGQAVQLNANVVSNPNTQLQSVNFNNNTMFAIPDGGVNSSWNGTSGNFATSNINVSGLSSTWQIENICLNIAHTYNSDVTVYLRTPCGDLIRLIRNNGGSGDNFTNTCFTPSASLSINNGNTPFSGSFIPSQGGGVWNIINACNNPNGTWSLLVGDAYSSDNGSLQNWSISFLNSTLLEYQFEWLPIGETNNISPIVSPNTTSTYIINVTNDMGCTSSDSVTVVVRPSLIPEFSLITSYCVGASIPALPTISNNGISGTWSPAINNTATTQYLFTPAPNQCADTFSVVIVVDNQIVPLFSQASAICSGEFLPALPTISNNGITGTWSPVINNTSTTIYTFVPDAGQCAIVSSMTIEVNPRVTPQFTQFASQCEGTTISAMPTTSNNGITGTWSPAINNTITTVYTFTPAAGQCANITTMTIDIMPNIVPTFTPYSSYCQNEVIPTLPNSSLNGISGSWSPAINNQVTTNYTFTPNSNQCAVSVEMEISIVELVFPIISTLDTSICIAGGNVVLQSPNTGGLWSGNGIIDSIQGVFSPAVSGKGIFNISYRIFAECSGADNVLIHVEDVPNVEILGDSLLDLCQGNQITLSGISSTNYLWSNGNTNSSINVSSGGQYILQAANFCGISEDNVIVTQYEKPVISLGRDTSLCLGSGLLLSIPDIYAEYRWSTGERGNEILATYQDLYSVTVTTEQGCTSETRKYVKDSCDFFFYIPNAFTPDNDGLNEFFKAKGVGIEAFEMMIYDRWGKMVFRSLNIEDGWSGKDNNGKYFPNGLYVCKVNYTVRVNSQQLMHKVYVGNVVLIK